MNICISVVVPVYNTPKDKIERCVNSILNQTYKNLELILVDDGSAAEYASYLDEVAKKDNRIKLIHKENAGSAVARNTGVENASGEYCTFVDSDDLIFPFVLEEATGVINKYDLIDNGPDMIVGMVKRFVGDDADVYSKVAQSDKISYIEIKDDNQRNEFLNHVLGYVTEKYIFDTGYVADGPVAKVFKTQIGKNNPFTGEAYFDDDTVWNICILKDCKKITLIPNTWYAYMIYLGSKTRGFRPNCPKEYLYRINQEKQLCNELWAECNQGVSKRIWNATAILVRAYLIHPKNDRTARENYKTFKEIIHSETYIWALKNIDFNDFEAGYKRFIKNIVKFCALYGPNFIVYVFWKLMVRKEQNTF